MEPDHLLLTAALGGRYQVERAIGAGGMATVYLARDVKHDREVALKVLRPELTAILGAERFLQEIRITAKLDHPHILTLIDSGESGHFLWYVLPYVRGESLRQKLDREHQLAIDEAVAITRQIAGALDYAHRQGVIHRDIKPENILLFEGEATLADFGIALALKHAGGPRLTESGLSLGTPQYMSPEQAAGDRELDARTDVYSLGAVLYEMLAAEPPHTAPSVQAVIAKLLTERPTPLRIVRDSVPEGIDAAVAKALAKIPADRFAGAGQFADALTRAAGATPQVAEVRDLRSRGPAWPRSRRTRVAVGVGGLLITLALGGLWLRSRSTRGSSATPAARQVTFTGKVEVVDISRDGRFLAYASREGPKRKLLVQDLMGAGTPRELASLDWVGDVRWSPTGAQLLVSGMDSGHTVAYLVPLLGGTIRSLSLPQLADLNMAIGWSPDGSRVAIIDNDSKRVLLISLATGDTAAIRLHGSFNWTRSGAEWSPNGRLIAFVTSTETPLGHTLWVIRTDGTRQQAVIEDTVALASPHWSPGGDALYYLRSGSELRRVRVVSETGVPEASPTTLLDGLQTFNRFNDAATAAQSITSDGTRLAYTKGTAYANLWRLTTGATPSRQQLTTGTAAKFGVTVSPDGRWIGFVQRGHNGTDVFKVPIEGGVPQQLTSTGRVVTGILGSSLAWSPDGTSLAFGVIAGGARRWPPSAAVARLFAPSTPQNSAESLRTWRGRPVPESCTSAGGSGISGCWIPAQGTSGLSSRTTRPVS